MTPIRTIDTRSGLQAAGRAAQRGARRGVLLLIVLSMLTLFMMLGAAYLVAATRARTAAKAYAKLTFGADDAQIPAGAMLDAVMLRVLAGDPTNSPTGPAPIRFESLLADKYGSPASPLEGTATATVDGSTITADITNLTSDVHPSDLNGRILSFVQPGRPASSHRIIRAFAGGGSNAESQNVTAVLDRPWGQNGFADPPTGTARVLINGREFAGDPATDLNEAWDAFDEDNPFLARIVPVTDPSSASVKRISYHPNLTEGDLITELDGYDAGLARGVDNDGDGRLDGLFLDWGLPPGRDAFGNEVTLEASVLVVDLDGRFNVNAHGAWASLIYPPSHTGWTTTSLPNFALVPVGSGYGTPEVPANAGRRDSPKGPGGPSPPRIFDQDSLHESTDSKGSENPKLILITGAAPEPDPDKPDTAQPKQRGRRPTNSRYVPTTVTYRLPALQGKYGDGTMENWAAFSNTVNIFVSPPDFGAALPGFPGHDDPVSRLQDRRTIVSATTSSRSYGLPSTWWDGDPDFNWNPDDPNNPPPRGVYNSPPDLHGRMKTLTIAPTGSAVTPQLVFAQPEWAADSISRDDPYELLLDTRRGVGGWLNDPTHADTIHQYPLTTVHQNPFTLAELESVLRPYDVDSNRAPARLAAVLGSAAESSRLKVTTESWDTTVIVGGDPNEGAAARLAAWLRNATFSTDFYDLNPVRGVIGGEVSRSLKFDLNRALAPSLPGTDNYSMNPVASEYHVQRQAYFKDLYTLLVAVDQGDEDFVEPPTNDPTTTRAERNEKLAQWAANVVEFRDADSRIIPFEYDVNPQNGWGVDGDVRTNDGGERRVVWGCERPEMLIRETLAWRKDGSNAGMFIALHRPWNATAYGSGTDSIVAEPCDSAFDTLVDESGMPSGFGQPSNQIDLAKKAGPHVLVPGANSKWGNRDADAYPIWRLRIANTTTGQARYVRFDTDVPTTGATNELVAAAPSPIGADSTVTIYDSTIIERTQPLEPITVTIAASAIPSIIPNLEIPADWATDDNVLVYLERFSDPAHTPTKADWDAHPINGANQATSPYRYVVVDSLELPPPTEGGPITFQRRATDDADRAFWRSVAASGNVDANKSFPEPIPASERENVRWFPWPNRPFVSAAELLLVPQGNSQELLEEYEVLTTVNQESRGVPVPLQLLFDAVHVPSRFGGIHTTTSGANPVNSGIDSRITTVNQFSAFREPGRVNINTITSEDIWNTVIAGALDRPLDRAVPANQRIFATGTAAPPVIRTLLEALSLTRDGTAVLPDDRETPPTAPSDPSHVEGADKNPLHTVYTATRLANTVTTRSNIFAVWITLRESVAGDPDSVRLHRAFYIVDRSIPVAYEPDKPHNVWDCVRLRRVIE